MQRKLLVLPISVVWIFVACSSGGGQGQSASGNRGNSNRPPTISGVPSPTIFPGEVYEFSPNAADPDGDALQFTVLRKPAWASFDRTTGRLTGTPEVADVGSYSNIIISASDGRASVALRTFDIVVNQVGEGSVTLSWIPPTENANGSTLNNLAGYRIYYGRSVNSLNQSVALNNPGLTRYMVENLPRGRWHFAMTAVNTAGEQSTRTIAVSSVVG